MIKKEGYLNYIHLFRGFAILIIVSIHCRISFAWPKSSISRDIFITLLDNGTVLFVFIAGFLFQYLKAKFDYPVYLKRKAQYVLIPYLLVSIPAIAADLYSADVPAWMPESIADGPAILQALYMLASGKHLGPFWFIPMIVIFYIISPILLKLDKPWFYKTILPFLLIFTLFTYRFGFFSTTWHSFIHYLPVYVFGMCAGYYRLKIMQLPWLVIGLLAGIYLTIATLEVIDFIEIPKLSSFEEAKTAPFFAFNFAKLKETILCIIMLRVFHEVDRELALFKLLGDYSSGIYFVHLYVITVVEMVVKSTMPDFRLGALPFLLYVVIVTSISVLIVWIVKRIFGKYSRYMIGS